MVPKSLDAVLMTLPLPGAAALVGDGVVADDEGDGVSASDLAPVEGRLFQDAVSELPHPATMTTAARTGATIARIRQAKHGRAH
jgi:hypothetical protein